MKEIVEFVVHHSGGPRTQTVESIRKYHMRAKPKGRGYSDIAYHFIIDTSPKLWVGRPIPQTGAHAPPNAKRIGVCVIGDNTQPGREWTIWQKQRLLQLWQSVKMIWPEIELAGHRDVMPGHTECPGLDVRKLLLEE